MVAPQGLNPVMAGLFLSSVAASAGLLTLRWRRPGRLPVKPSLANLVGLTAVVATWFVFVPVNVWAHLTGDHDSWIFGSETFDGGVVETLTVAFYGLACLQAVALFRRAGDLYGQASAGLWRLILGLGLVGFVLMIGEELSWGQHILHFQTPEDLVQANLQGEANLHNLVSPRIYDMVYQGLGWTLILLPAIAAFWRSAPASSLTTFLRGLFAWPFTYVLLASSGMLLQHEVFEEMSEMVLAVTVLQTLLALGEQRIARSQAAPVASSAGRVVMAKQAAKAT